MRRRLKRLSQQVIVITGASSGIGLATARMAAAAGARVVLNSRDAVDLEQAVERIRADGGEATCVAGDVADLESMKRVAATAIRKFGESSAVPTSGRSAADFIPPRPTLAKLREAAAHCRGCDLWKGATQTVFGEGPAHARLMLVGEQPGDQEDKVGRPFVGPAGRLLDEGLEAAGLDRRQAYLTNAVKHFKFVRKELTKRRLHKKPTAAEVRACRPWLEWEIRLVKPLVIVALGATAGQALLGPKFRVTEQRGKPIPSEWADAVIATVHPSSVLRAPSEVRERARREFFQDLKRAARYLESLERRLSESTAPAGLGRGSGATASAGLRRDRGPRLRRGTALPPVAAGRPEGSVVGRDRPA